MNNSPAPLVKSLRRLGSRLWHQWQGTHQDPAAFAALATAALRAAMPSLLASPEAWVRALVCQTKLARQHLTSRFGEPPVTVFAYGNLRVEVYFWRSPHTAIHDHAFSGAFGVAWGCSLQERYAFVSDNPASQPVREGQLRRVAAEMLQQGDVRAIDGPDRCLHRVAHLDVPTVSICVRTARDVGAPVQCTYFAPGLAVHLDDRFSPETRRRIELARMLMLADVPDAASVVHDMVRSAQDAEAFYLLWRLFEAGIGVDRLFGLLPERPWAGALLPAFFEHLHETAAWAQAAGLSGRLALARQRVAMVQPG